MVGSRGPQEINQETKGRGRTELSRMVKQVPQGFRTANIRFVRENRTF